jgi:hypothetical protein
MQADRRWPRSVQQIPQKMDGQGSGGIHRARWSRPVFIGDPQQIATQLEAWVDETGIDGFNLAFAIAHETMRDVVNLIVPELQRRKRYKTRYASGSCDISCSAKVLIYLQIMPDAVSITPRSQLQLQPDYFFFESAS